MAESCKIMQNLTWQPICCIVQDIFFQASHARAAQMYSSETALALSNALP